MRSPWMTIIALSAGLGLAGCGDLIGDRIDELVQDAGGQTGDGADDGALSEAAAHEAAVLGADVDVAVAELEADEAADAALDELEAVEFNADEGLGSLAPGLAGFLPAQERDGDRGLERSTTVERYDGGRIKSLVRTHSFGGGPRESITYELHFTYSSGTSVSGDLNDAEPVRSGGPHGYVYSDVTGTTAFRDGASTAELTGFRHWHSDEDVRYLVFDLIQVLPDDERSPFVEMRWAGDFGADDPDGGVFTRTIELPDGGIDERRWEIAVRGGTIDVDYERTGPHGFEADGSGSYDFNGTRRCRLDDVGEFRLVRRFAAADTDAAVPVSETIERFRDGLVVDATGELTLSDDRVLTRERHRETVTPTRCDDRDGTREERVEATTYGGTAVDFTILRDRETTSLEGTRTATDGTTVELSVIRAEGLTDILVTRRDPAGELLAELDLVVDPTGHATGTLTRYLDDGSVVVTEVDRDVDGRLVLKRRGGDGPDAKRQFRRINRGEL